MTNVTRSMNILRLEPMQKGGQAIEGYAPAKAKIPMETLTGKYVCEDYLRWQHPSV